MRTVACVALALAGTTTGSVQLLLAALAVYWVGDIADGLVARWRDEETRTGAVLDVICDRLCVSVVYLGLVAERPEFTAALGVYLIEFMAVDAVLSLAFLRWPIAGPNYFDRVDPLVWRLNWWTPAKMVNSALVVLLCFATGSPLLALATATGLLVLKTVSLIRVARLLGARGEPCGGHHS